MPLPNGLSAPPTAVAAPEPAPLAMARVAPPIDLSTDGAIDAWPRLIPGIEARAFTSYDRSGGNDDGFAGTYSELYTDAHGEHVIFDALGPGALRTLWFTSDIDGNGPLPEGKVRFYVDEEDNPRITIDANSIYTGKAAPFVVPLVADNQSSSGGFASWVPVVFAKRLKSTTEVRAGFYQAHCESFPANWSVETSHVDAMNAGLVDRFSRTDFSQFSLSEGPLDRTESGAGVIDVLRFEPLVAPSAADLNGARIRIWFDGGASPHVDVPLGMFFGSGLGEATIRAVPWTMVPGRYESRFPMPYWDGFRVAVSGLAGRLSLHVSASRWPREETGTFEAIYHEARPTVSAEDFVYADATGAGKLVGTVLTVEPLAPSNKQWWEGDLQSYVDDARTPAIHGTGHEDDHLGGWSNEFLERPFTQPMQGCPKTELLDHTPGAQYNANATMYRLFPGIPFLRRLRHATEHGPGNARNANYAAATFLYRQARERLVKSDEIVVADGRQASAHEYASVAFTAAPPLASQLEAGGPDISATVHDYAESVSFRLAIAKSNAGVKLRRLYDQITPGQRARVEVDGAVVGSWYIAEGSTSHRWGERDFFLPPEVTVGKSSLAVRLVPEGPFGAARFQAWSVLP